MIDRATETPTAASLPATISRGVADAAVDPFDLAPSETSPPPENVVVELPVSSPLVSMLAIARPNEMPTETPMLEAPDTACAVVSCSARRMKSSSCPGAVGRSTTLSMVSVWATQVEPSHW